MDARVFRRDVFNRTDGFDGVSAGFFLTGGDWEGEGVDDDVLNPHSPVVDEGVNEATRNSHLVFAGSRLAFLVDGEGNHGGTVFFHERHHGGKARPRTVSVFEVHRIHDRATPNQFQPGLDHGGLGGVDDEGKC